MRGKKIAVLAFSIGVLIVSGAYAETGQCFYPQKEGVVAGDLLSKADVRKYADENHRQFATIGVDACLDARNGLKVTAAWLRHALPPGPALDKILASSVAHGFRPWSLLLALHSRVVERLHKEEEATSAAHERMADPIGDIIGGLKLDKN